MYRSVVILGSTQYLPLLSHFAMKITWWIFPVHTHPLPAPVHTSTVIITTPSITATTYTHTPPPKKEGKSHRAKDRTCLSGRIC